MTPFPPKKNPNITVVGIVDMAVNGELEREIGIQMMKVNMANISIGSNIGFLLPGHSVYF